MNDEKLNSPTEEVSISFLEESVDGKRLSSTKMLLLAARTISDIFNPFYLPVVGMILIFWLSYMNEIPWQYRLLITAEVYLFTTFFPQILIRIYRSYHGWTLFQLSQKERRFVPYFITIVCYFACYYMMFRAHVPHWISLVLVVALAIQIICSILNAFWKVSTHSAGMGGVTGLLSIYSIVFHFPLLFWLCISLLLSGAVASSRMLLRQHSLGEVVGGFLLGAFLSIMIAITF